MRLHTIELYQFDELDNKAKEKAREWFRRASDDDTFWSECAIDDAKEVLSYLGFDIGKVYWSGFWSQGDGACFDKTTWTASQVKVKGWEEMQDKEIEALHAEFAALAKEYPEATGSIKHKGHYNHENCTEFDCEGFEHERETEQGDVPVWSDTDESNFIEFAKDCMRWTYKQLEAAYDWQNADKQIDDNIIANEYEFTKEGRRA